MQDIRPREGLRGGLAKPARTAARRLVLGAAMLCLTLAGQGCASITTPLPDTHPHVTSSISQQDRKKEMDELQSKAATHEQDAERQIENSR
jgi:hypothetical protein